MNKLKSALKIVSVFAFVLFCFQSIPAQNRTLLNQAERVTGDRFTIATQTPKGALVYAVNRPNNKMLQAIDNGLTDLFAVAEENGYRKRLNYSDYTIFIAKADRTQNKDRNYSPDIAVNAAQYAGTDFDQGGFIYAAGMVLGYNPCAFVFAEHTKNFERVSEVVRYEGEHLVLFHNDRRLYRQTADHSQGGGHPILK
jgi:hypothetical protein